jgi:AraC family transcriptional regulator, transcriptional activator of pobA
MPKVIHIKSISQYHQALGLPMPDHPHFSVIEISGLQKLEEPVTLLYDFYIIFMKRDPEGRFKYRYGNRTVTLVENDFVTSKLFFMSPGQTLGIENNNPDATMTSGWIILIHPDFLWKTRLAKTISQYEFFYYSVSESLYLAPQEEKKIMSIIESIQDEYKSKIDKYSQDVVIAELELLFTYAERFYNRQFVTRKITNHGILERLEELLNNYFNDPELIKQGLPTVQYISNHLNISPNYLRSLLKSFTGLNTQEHIHKKLIEKAKEKLSTTELSVSEIAYELGFEHPPSFSKLFKNKTNVSPVEFRQSL